MSASGSRVQRVVALLLIPVAVAIAIALLLLRLHFEPPAVPPYALVSDAGGGVVTARHGEPFSLEIRPTEHAAGAVAARGFLLRGDEVRPWEPPFEVAKDGTVRVAGPVDSLFAGVPPGAWQVAVAVGRPETLPTAPRDVLRARDADGGTTAWRLVVEPIRLE